MDKIKKIKTCNKYPPPLPKRRKATESVFCRVMTKIFKYTRKILYIGHCARTNKVRSADIALLHTVLSEHCAEK